MQNRREVGAMRWREPGFKPQLPPLSCVSSSKLLSSRKKEFKKIFLMGLLEKQTSWLGLGITSDQCCGGQFYVPTRLGCHPQLFSQTLS